MSSESHTTSTEGHERFRTLQITASLANDTAASTRIMARAAEARHAKGRGSVQIVGSSGGRSAEGGEDGWARRTWRIWWTPPTLWREELRWPGGQTVVTVVRPDLWQSYVSMHGTVYTSEPAPERGKLAALGNRLFGRAPHGSWPPEAVHRSTVAERLAEFPLTAPRPRAPEWELTTLGEELHLGRTVRRVRATRRSSSADVSGTRRSGYWSWLNEYEYLVDDALDILLRLTGLEVGKPVAIVSADEVLVDAPMPKDVFSVTPPEGTHVTHLEQRT